MATLTEAIRAVLMNAGVSPVFSIEAPDVADSAVVVIPYGSIAEVDLPVGTQSFQVRCRAKSFVASEGLAWDVFRTLVKGVYGADRRVLSTISRQEPFFLGKDEKGRYVHEFNLDVTAVWKE